MQALDKTLRNKLERTVIEARDIAEAAARAAVEQLGVGESNPYGYLGDGERELRRKLRIHGRQLSDLLHEQKKTQEIDMLVEEIAYEHWHRMIFARFLAENDLLMYSVDDPIPVSLGECEDLAAEEGAKNGWELAARYAARMLPQVFRTDSPVFLLELPPEHQQRLERLLDELPTEVFLASDSLGWVYQFWQTKKKKEVNASEVKIGARELPAVTQLFTEPYMVSFLLDNSLGAWWAARRLTEDDLRNAGSEEELRDKASLPGVPLEYLRFVKGEDGKWTPAAGTFDAWPEKLADLKTLDPCCGSGHFLVAALLMLVPMRMEMEGLSAGDAVDAALRENIHGLEIDQRCVELAAFALALTAWRYPDAGGYRRLPELNVACSGLSISTKKEDWLALAGDDSSLLFHLEQLYNLFSDAPTLGSLINPSRIFKADSLFAKDWKSVQPILTKALTKEKSYEKVEMGVVVSGMFEAASLLASSYTLVITNVPYLGRGKQNDLLKDYLERNYDDGKADLATAFVLRCGEFCHNNGTSGIVTPQNWLSQTTYTKLREQLLVQRQWNIVARLGEHAFESNAAAGAFAAMIMFSGSRPNADHVMAGIDVSAPRGKRPIYSAEKSPLIRGDMEAAEEAANLTKGSGRQPSDADGSVLMMLQREQRNNPDATIRFENTTGIGFVRDYAGCYQGLTTGDDPRLKRRFWEIQQLDHISSAFWKKLQGTSQGKGLFAGRENLVDGRITTGELRTGALRGREAWGKQGVAIDRVALLSPALYCGDYYHSLIPVLIPRNKDDLPAILAFAVSDDLRNVARNANQSLSIDNGYFEKFEFDLDHWTKVAEEKYPNGLPEPYSDDPTQWVFHGHPAQSDEPLQVAVARLFGYRWPAELDAEMELSDDARALVKKCNELLDFTDKDGIVCIPPVRGEAAAADRLLNLLAAAYGDAWSTDKLSELLKTADHQGKTLDSWLRDKFFIQHCKLFHHRPFIWHIWDGLGDGFSALVNYHKLDRKNLETLIYTYLGDWILRQKDDISSGVDGAQEHLAAAEYLKKQLELVLQGEKPYDTFVRWKLKEKQPIGWEPDLNDGVRLNIRPFTSVGDVRKKDAGVLRDKPNIHWKKDRGKDVASAPWYDLGTEYGGKEGDRINDHHLSLDEKRNAREDAE